MHYASVCSSRSVLSLLSRPFTHKMQLSRWRNLSIYRLSLWLMTYDSHPSPFRLADFRLQTSDFRLETWDFRLQTSDFRLQIIIISNIIYIPIPNQHRGCWLFPTKLYIFPLEKSRWFFLPEEKKEKSWATKNDKKKKRTRERRREEESQIASEQQ